ncbi:MAG: patatin-like phospholipase family protein [Anaerolineales bacterium]|nr:MAG: patatin-like phospholipase family protein [Anaerolineales bacterium]
MARHTAPVALALGGGGTKGIAHLGVLRAMERLGLRVEAIAGTSIGGLVGAVYATGRPLEQVIARVASMTQSGLFRRGKEIDNALLGLEGVAEVLLDLVGEKYFEELPIPLAVTAVDLNTGQEIVLNSGRVLDAVLATIALPGIFPPRVIGEHTLIDGGVSNPVPVSVARRLRPGLPVVASVLSAPPMAEKPLPVTNLLPPMPVLERLSQFRLARALTVFTQAMSINGRVLTEMRLDIEKPDVVLRPDVDHIGLLDPIDLEDFLARGEQAAADLKLGWGLRARSRVRAWLAGDRA